MREGRLRGDQGAIALAEKVLLVLELGSYSATYKYALFTAILDLCLEKTLASGEPPTSLTTRQLAEKTVELYWPHAVPYRGAVLRQGGGAGEQAEILRNVSAFRDSGDDDLLHRARLHRPEAFDQLVREVEWKLIEMPIPRLQLFGRREERFLYTYGWTVEVKKGAVSAYQRGDSSTFDNRVLLQPGVAEDLVRLNGVLRPLLHREWAQMVARMNGMSESKLEDFLFGIDRISLAHVRGPLRELQRAECFYCGERLPANCDVDHFIPWSRYPDNGLDNLIAAHARCNNNKRDFLAAAKHVEEWVQRLQKQGSALAALAEDLHWEREAGRSRAVAVAMYRRLTSESRLWLRIDEFVPPESERIHAALLAA